MYAVIQTGGKQYRVAPGDTIRIERVKGDVGEQVKFGTVLAVHTDVTERVSLDEFLNVIRVHALSAAAYLGGA